MRGPAATHTIKNLKTKNVISESFFYDVNNGHFCSCPNSKVNILQKELIFLRLLDIPLGLSTQCSQLTVKKTFAPSTKLQCFIKSSVV